MKLGQLHQHQGEQRTKMLIKKKNYRNLTNQKFERKKKCHANQLNIQGR